MVVLLSCRVLILPQLVPLGPTQVPTVVLPTWFNIRDYRLVVYLKAGRLQVGVVVALLKIV